MINNFLLDIELGALEDFFRRNLARDKWEIEYILSEHEEGKYAGLDDLDNALFVPTKHLEISIRAVYYELTSLIEYEMRLLAGYLSKTNHILDITFSKIFDVYYKSNINLAKISAYETINRILDIANSYKHRKGLTRLREMEKIPQYRELGDPEDALKAIDETRRFLI